MAMTDEKLRSALSGLDGRRDVRIEFGSGADACIVPKALVLPAEADGIVKLTDGAREYLLDAEQVAWIEIGPPVVPTA